MVYFIKPFYRLQVDGAWFKQYVSLKVFRFQEITSKEVKVGEEATLTCTVVGLTYEGDASNIKWTKGGVTIPSVGNTVSGFSSEVDRSRMYPDGMITTKLTILGSETAQDDTVTCHFQVSFFQIIFISLFLRCRFLHLLLCCF